MHLIDYLPFEGWHDIVLYLLKYVRNGFNNLIFYLEKVGIVFVRDHGYILLVFIYSLHKIFHELVLPFIVVIETPFEGVFDDLYNSILDF